MGSRERARRQQAAAKQRRDAERAARAARRRRWQFSIAISLIVIGIGGSVANYALSGDRETIRFSEDIQALLDIDGGRWRYTFAATDAAGVPVLASDGVLDWEAQRCTTSGRVLAGTVVVNPASDPGDIRAVMESAEVGRGVGRIYDEDGERVELADGSDGGRVPVPWLEPLGAAVTGLCDQVRLHLALLRNPVEIGDTHPIDAAVRVQDSEEGATRWVATYDETLLRELRAEEAGEVQMRTELVRRADGEWSIVVRSLSGTDRAPSIIVAQLNLELLSREPQSEDRS